MLKPRRNISLFLLAAFSLVCSYMPSTSFASDCQNLTQRQQSSVTKADAAEARAESAQQHIRKLASQIRSLRQQYATAPPADRPALLDQADQLDAAYKTNLNAFNSGLLDYILHMQAQRTTLQQLQSNQCAGQIDLAKVDERINTARQAQAGSSMRLAQLNQGVSLRQSIQGSASPPKQPTQARSDSRPTIRVVNNTDMPICVHPSGMSGGTCFAASKARVYTLDELTGWDMDSGARPSTNQLVVVGGGTWTGSPYTSYQGMTLCTQRVFTHETGEVVWEISTGMEENCGVRGYHQ